MNDTNRTPCLKNTRRNVTDDILNWIADDSNEAKMVLWVYVWLGRDGKEYSVDYDCTNDA